LNRLEGVAPAAEAVVPAVEPEGMAYIAEPRDVFREDKRLSARDSDPSRLAPPSVDASGPGRFDPVYCSL